MIILYQKILIRQCIYRSNVMCLLFFECIRKPIYRKNRYIRKKRSILQSWFTFIQVLCIYFKYANVLTPIYRIPRRL